MATFTGGQVTVGTTAARLASVSATKEIYLQADRTNTGLIILGGSARQDFDLQAGDVLFMELNNLNVLYAKASVAGQKLNYIIVN